MEGKAHTVLERKLLQSGKPQEEALGNSRKKKLSQKYTWSRKPSSWRWSERESKKKCVSETGSTGGSLPAA